METSPTGVGVRKFRERSEGERLLQAVNVNESQTGHVRETSPTGVRCEKFQGKFRAGVSTYLLQR